MPEKKSTTNSVSARIERLKKRPLVVVTLLIVAVVGGLASFLGSLKTITHYVGPLVAAKPEPKIIPARSPLTDKEAEDQGFIIDPMTQPLSNYGLLLHVTASFRTVRFNRSPYLDSVRELRVSPQKEPWEEQKNPWENSRDEKITLFQDKSTDSRLSGNAFLKLRFRSPPIPKQPIYFSLGPFHWEVSIGSHRWEALPYKIGGKEMGGNDFWYRAQGEIAFELPDPDWAIIRTARLLPTNQTDLSVLEVVVENLSGQSVPLEDLTIAAHHPKSSGIKGFRADPWQDLTLHWDSIVAQQSSGNAWTTLEDTQVAVPVRFRGLGHASDYAFIAEVPVQQTIDPKGVGRITLRIREMPSTSSPGRSSPTIDLRGRPSALAQWANISITVNPRKTSAPVFPQQFDVSRSK